MIALAEDPGSTPDIRTPPAPPTPRINGPRVYGARPGHPFFYHLPVTGERPIKFAAQGLPAGLTLDPATGNVSGATTEQGTHPVEFSATNARGTDKARLDVVIGDTICLTPPLGWNSWNHFGNHVMGQHVREAADAMVASGLLDHGWTYVNVDDCWQGVRDEDGVIHGNEKFADMKALADYVHARGLKFGVYSSPGPKTCAGFEGSLGHEDQDARTYAEWGVDYVKYDLCSYSTIADKQIHERTLALLPADQRPRYEQLLAARTALPVSFARTPEQAAQFTKIQSELFVLLKPTEAAAKAISVEENRPPYEKFGQSLAKVPRDIIFSLCQYGNADSWEWAAGVGGNCWRTTGDIKPNWDRMSKIGFRQENLAKYASPGHWNDPDMLEAGNKGLTPDECYLHVTLWAMLNAPLLIGCDMSKMDAFTVGLFSNDEVLAVDQDTLGKQGYRLKAEGTTEVWVKPLADGTLAVAFFNRGETGAKVAVSLEQLAVARGGVINDSDAIPMLWDVWRQRSYGRMRGAVAVTVAPHGAELLRFGTIGDFPRDR